jgi:hypothetical protein
VDPVTHHTRPEPRDRRLIPPFTALFFPSEASTCPCRDLVTPRNAARLWAAPAQLADVLDAQLTDVTSRLPLSHSEWGRLPWVVGNAPADWFGGLIDAIFSLGDDAASGRCPVPRCTAEEMALHLILEDITASRDPDLLDLASTACAGLPVLDWDNRWDIVAAALFPDPHVRTLIADGFGGIDDDYELVAETGIVRLAVSRWFEPCNDDVPERPALACGCEAPS